MKKSLIPLVEVDFPTKGILYVQIRGDHAIRSEDMTSGLPIQAILSAPAGSGKTQSVAERTARRE